VVYYPIAIFTPQERASDTEQEIPGESGGRGQQREYEEFRPAGEWGHSRRVHPATPGTCM